MIVHNHVVAPKLAVVATMWLHPKLAVCCSCATAAKLLQQLWVSSTGGSSL